MEYPLKSRQICLFLIAFMPITKLFMMPSVVAAVTGEDIWISTLTNFLADFLTLSVLVLCCKKNDCDFFTLLSRNYGTVVAKAVYLLYFVFFLLKSVLPVCELNDYIELSLYINMPSILYFLPFFFVAFYLLTKHLRVLGRLADITWFLSVMGVIMLIGLSVENVDFGAIMPVGAHGIKNILAGSYKSLVWFGDGVYMLFFMGKFGYKKRDYIKIAVSYGITALITIFFMMIFYGTFLSISFRQRFALTDISKYSTVINNIGRFDYIAIFCIIIAETVGVSLPLYFANYTFSHVVTIKKKWIMPLIICAAVLSVVYFLEQYFKSIEYFFINTVNPMFIIMGNVIPVLSVFLPCRRAVHTNFEKIKGGALDENS